jgi:hypothetical protein
MPLTDSNGMATRTLSEWLTLIHLAADSLTQYGTTAQRPTANLFIGRPYFDTTLGYIIHVKQVTPTVIWVNGSGVSV